MQTSDLEIKGLAVQGCQHFVGLIVRPDDLLNYRRVIAGGADDGQYAVGQFDRAGPMTWVGNWR